MGFPSTGKESMYRNPRDNVVKFLNTRHPEGWKLYNLCSEKSYQYTPETFGGRFSSFPFSDHCPAPIALIKEFCNDVNNYLSQGRATVAAVHCKAGKGRSGTMICALLAYAYGTQNMEKVMRDYAARRSWKGQGVTVPSQKHVLDLFSQCISAPAELRKPPSWRADPFVRHPKAKWSLTELRLGPFFDESTTNKAVVKMNLVMDDTTANFDNVPMTWSGTVMVLRPRIDSTGDFGRIDVKIVLKSLPKIQAGLWIHYVAMERSAENDGSYVLKWPKSFISSIGKKDKANKILPADFSAEARFSVEI